MVSTVRPNLNAVAIVPDDLDGQIASTGFCVLRSNPHLVIPRYLFYRAQHPEFIDFLVTNATGASYPAVTDSVVRCASLPLPSLQEQSRIVELLDQADRLRRLRREADAKAARILPALFLKMFGDPATNPMGWPVRPLSDFADTARRINPSTCPDEVFRYIDITSVDGERGVIATAKTITGRDAPSRARQRVRWRDTLISTVRPYLRATALVPRELDEEIASTGFCVLRPKKQYGYAWQYQLTRQQWFTEQLNARARGASYPAVTDDDIFQLSVPVPTDPSLLAQFDNEFESLTETLSHAGSASGKVDELFDLLLQRAFSGQLTAKWREAHMKELLAEMEHQARLLDLPLPGAQDLA